MEIEPFMQIYLSGEETYASGEVIIEEGSEAKWIYILLEGQAKVTKRTAAGLVTIAVLKPGAIIGEMSLLGKLIGGRSASVFAVDGPVRLGVLDSEGLRRDYEHLSPRLRLLIGELVSKVKESNERAAALVVAVNSKNGNSD